MKKPFSILTDLFSKFFNKPKPPLPAGSGFEPLFDFLMKEISVPKQAERLIAVGKKMKGKQADELLRNYISFEHYLTNLDPEQKYTREKLRHSVMQKFPDLMQERFFSILFAPEAVQKQKLAAVFADFCLQEASAYFGNAASGLFEQLTKDQLVYENDPNHENALQQLQALIDQIFTYTYRNWGGQLAEAIFERSYQKTARYFKEAGIIHYLANILPQSVVLSSLLSDLTQAQTQKVVRDKMEETQRLNEVLGHQLQQLKQTRDEVRKHESMLSGIISCSLDAIITIDEEGCIVNWNHAAEDIFGYSYEEAKGQYMYDLIIPAALRASHKEGFSRYLRTRDSKVMGRRMRLKAQRRNGSQFSAELTITHIEYNNFHYFNGFLRDISEQVQQEDELKLAREKAEQAVKARTEFLNMVSHEIKTPLNAIIGFTRMLLNKSLDEKEQRQYVSLLQHNSESLLHIVNDILDFNQLDGGRKELVNEVFSLKELLDNICTSFIVTATEKHIPVSLQYDERLPMLVSGDAKELGVILNNLLGNAVKFTHKGFIKIGARLVSLQGDELTIDFSVQDTGIGIPYDKQDAIFEFFTQAESHNTRQYGGTGMGLSLVRKTVQLMKGEIFLTSKPGEGSVFRFRIALGRVNPDALQALPPAPAYPDVSTIFTGKSVLLAEDIPLNVIIARQLIEDWGATVEVAYNGLEALEFCREHHYDLVLMDLQMPVMDGITSSEEIRKFNQLLPIIALTATAQLEVPEHIYGNSLTDYIPKPIDPAELYTKMCKYLLDEFPS